MRIVLVGIAFLCLMAAGLRADDGAAGEALSKDIKAPASGGEAFYPRAAFYENIERILKKEITVDEDTDNEAFHPKASYEDFIDDMFTHGRANGNYIVGFIEKSKGGLSKVRTYIYAVLDTLSEVDKEALRKIYPKATFDQVSEQVITYYKENPLKRKRTVVDVVLSGCK